jgi:hypothetical protein
MVPHRLVMMLALVTACYQRDPTVFETFPEPSTMSGPPGGMIDPAWSAQQYDAYGGYPDGTSPGSEHGFVDPGAGAYAEPSADPQSEGYVMGTLTDEEIEFTLEPYGEWVELDGYGFVWRPYPTAVGVDFTPYESCGTWVWTDWGWTFACDWEWGWLPFHYGRWGWFDDYWAWAPDYDWGPGWVEWRGGGGYTGWRPLAPTVRDHRRWQGPRVRDHRTAQGPRVRDHRTGQGPNIRDHRTAKTMDSHWRFSGDKDLGKRIRPNLFHNPAEGLRVTTPVVRPPVRGTMQPVRAASIMRGRLAIGSAMGVRGPRPDVGRHPDGRRP